MGWRAIQDNVDESESLAELTDFAERLYWRLVAKSDPWGRLPGSIAKIRARCVPLLETPPARIHDALNELEHVNRIARYETAGVSVVQIVDFDENQPTDLLRKRGKSLLPGQGQTRADKGSEGQERADKGRLEEEKKRREQPLPQNPRPRDEIWDSLTQELRSQPETKTERGRWNAAVKQLRDASATPEQIAARCREYRKRWPGVSLTPTALAANWGSLAPPARKLASAPCPDCGVGDGRHLADCPSVAVTA